MIKKFTIFIFLIITFCGVVQSQSEDVAIFQKSILGIEYGTGFFQQVRLNLTNFDGEILATSENLVPTIFKANFHYYFTPNFALRFASGYGFAYQANKFFVDYSIIDTLNLQLKDNTTFLMSGFPVETALIAQTSLDAQDKFMVHFGLGIGFYTYNYRAEGTFKQFQEDKKPSEQEYINPEMTLSGWAQYFTAGMNIQINQYIGASFEVAKVGFSQMKIENDVVKQVRYDSNTINDFKYGNQIQNYSTKSGLEDLAISAGFYLIL